jgi:hypothetical protein
LATPVLASKITVSEMPSFNIEKTCPNSAFANEGRSQINELLAMDSFHPPMSDDPRILMYREWHYFNIFDEEQNLSFITTLTLNGNISDPTESAAVVLINYLTPVKNNLTIDAYPVTLAQWSNKTPNLEISMSTVMLTERGYHVHVESMDTIFDAIFKPEAENGTVFKVPVESGRIINWLVASPKMNVNGRLIINKGTPQEKTYVLKNVRGYHDHNWGYWLWQDDLGWDWGQASGKYTFAFGNITNNNHTASRAAVLQVWNNNKIVAIFKDSEIKIRRDKMMNISQLPNNSFPLVTVLNASSGDNTINIVFTTERFTPILLPFEGGYRIIWELSGTYKVNRYIDEKQISYETKGYLEYVAELLIL